MAPPAKKMSNGTRAYERDSKSKKTETESVQRELAKLKEKSPKTVAEESEDSSSDEEFFDPKELGDAEEGSKVEIT
jgi:replication initiation and membrane attachment protein DnaB